MMVKVANFWMDPEKITFAVQEPDDSLRICFVRDNWIEIPGEQKKYIAEAVAILDAAAGCTPVSKSNTERKEALYGVDSEGRAVEMPIPPPFSQPTEVPYRRIDLLYSLSPEQIIKYLRLTRCCPPDRGCRNIPFGHEPFPDCDKCWLNWFGEFERPGEADI